MAVYKEEEFQAFLKFIEASHAQYWNRIAELLGVDKNTISAWKKLPEARAAIIKGISHSLSEMERTGKNDWRMHHAKLKMLGFTEKVEIDARIKSNPVEDILKGCGLLNEGGNLLNDT